MQPPSGGRIATVAVLVGVLSGQIAIIVASTLRSAEESSDALWRDNLLTLNIFTGCAILFIVAIFLLRLPALLLTRRLKRAFPGAVVYSVANNKDPRLIFDKLLRENGIRAGSPLTLYLGVIADGSGMSFWPTGPRDAKPSFLPWSAVQVVAAGGALDQGRSIPGVIVGVRQGNDLTYLPLVVVGRGLFGALGQSARATAIFAEQFEALRTASSVAAD